MVRLYILLLAIIFHIFPCSGNANESKLLPTIKITPNIWGGAKTTDIHKVLLSTARQFLPYFNQDEPFCIIVNRSKTGPIVHIVPFKTGPETSLELPPYYSLSI